VPRHRESAAEFNLRMSREEIGCYLGLKLDTVSRMLSRLRQRGVIDILGKQTASSTWTNSPTSDRLA
jgi:CRP-like cAMP-binding protein